MLTFEVDMNPEMLSKAKAKFFKSLSSKKERDRHSLFIAEGEKCVLDTLAAFEIEAIVCTNDWFENHRDQLEKYDDKVVLTDKRGIEIISSLNSLPEVIAVLKKPDCSTEIPRLDPDNLYLLLDEIQDPGNLGTIIRTCDWFGVYNIFASKNTADVYGPKVVQATMGSLSRVSVIYLDLEELILKNRHMKVLGTLLDGTPYTETGTSNGLLVMGNEGKGISDSLKKLIDIPVTIPPANHSAHPDSLNVAIATAILLSEITSPKPNT